MEPRVSPGVFLWHLVSMKPELFGELLICFGCNMYVFILLFFNCFFLSHGSCSVLYFLLETQVCIQKDSCPYFLFLELLLASLTQCPPMTHNPLFQRHISPWLRGAPARHLPSVESDASPAAVVRFSTPLFTLLPRFSLHLSPQRSTSPAFPSACDSQKVLGPCPPSLPTCHTDAAHLEEEYVHQVYNSIASHFSGTRHSPWPRVCHFLKSLSPGSLLADVGCGNGKYLGVNPQLVAVSPVQVSLLFLSLIKE